METLNHSLFMYINSFAGHNFLVDKLGIIIGEYMPYLFIGIEVWLYFFKKLKKEALYAFYAVLLGLILNQIIGLFYFHPRPFMDGLGQTLVYHVSENSFPSDHTTFMASIAFALIFIRNTRSLGFFLLLLAIIGGMARVFIGVHYPFDILGSLFTSIVSATFVVLFKNYFDKMSTLIFRIEEWIFKGKI